MLLLRRALSTPSRFHAIRCLSTTAAEPLFLWLGGGGDQSSATSSPPILLPVQRPSAPSVHSVSDITEAVHKVYETIQITDMGDNDPGVSFCSASGEDDTLAFLDTIVQSIDSIRQERHGIPFTIYTAGRVPTLPSGLVELGATLNVSLYAPNPTAYQELTGSGEFGSVCGFLVQCAESGVPVECSFHESCASQARQLALSLGAKNVHVYK